jgi:hypothetical protein
LSYSSLRALLAIWVVFVMLAATGWTAMHPYKAPADSRAAAVAAWLHGSVNGGRLPSLGAGAGTIARFFAGLSATQSRALAARYPLVVGNLNGAPVALRYAANHQALADARTEEIKRSHSALLTAAGRQEAGLLASRYASMMSAGRQILAFDPTGSGLAAEVFGNLDTAQRISIVVPGVDTNMLTFERPVDAYQAPDGMANSLYDAERAMDPAARTAVIAWANYTTPAGLGLDATTGTLAEFGATRLESLVSALPGGASVSLFCHSYGSVLCGVAAPHLPSKKISDITVFGSPGMRVKNVAGLHTRARVWSARDSTDWISDVPHLEIAGIGHGADPVSRAFGARVISAAGAQGHAGYFQPGTTSLENFARIALGQYTAVHCAEGNSCTAGLA